MAGILYYSVGICNTRKKCYTATQQTCRNPSFEEKCIPIHVLTILPQPPPSPPSDSKY